MPFTEQKHNPSVTTWQMGRDAMLDHISYLEDNRSRASDYLALCVTNGLIPQFEAAELMLLLWESKDESEKRRWAQMEEQND